VRIESATILHRFIIATKEGKHYSIPKRSNLRLLLPGKPAEDYYVSSVAAFR
jgi:hypothetical protein